MKQTCQVEVESCNLFGQLFTITEDHTGLHRAELVYSHLQLVIVMISLSLKSDDNEFRVTDAKDLKDLIEMAGPQSLRVTRDFLS